MEQWKKDQLDLLERAGYIPILRELARSHTCPFYWYDDSRPLGDSILHNGTATVINTGTATLAVSANHVYAQYLQDKKRMPHLKCQFGGVTIDPELYVASENAALDIVTFELPSILVAGSGVTIHNSRVWPPDKLQQSELVIFGGYPGHRRTERDGALDTDFVTFISRVTQSSDDHFSVYLDLTNSHWPQGETVGERPDLGGASGGPVFRFRTEPIEVLEFAGVIYESSQEFELVYARHANHISPRGVITC
jgi:hypothetical protein